MSQISRSGLRLPGAISVSAQRLPQSPSRSTTSPSSTPIAVRWYSTPRPPASTRRSTTPAPSRTKALHQDRPGNARQAVEQLVEMVAAAKEFADDEGGPTLRENFRGQSNGAELPVPAHGKSIARDRNNSVQ